jgi:hypothetical protein
MTTFNLSLALTICWVAVSAQLKKPNVILFMADDMGIGDTSAYLGVKLIPQAEERLRHCGDRQIPCRDGFRRRVRSTG